MRKVIFGGANTLDNYIAGPNDSIDWIRHDKEVQEIMKRYWETIDTVTRYYNPQLAIDGVLFTMFDGRLSVANARCRARCPSWCCAERWE